MAKARRIRARTFAEPVQVRLLVEDWDRLAAATSGGGRFRRALFLRAVVRAALDEVERRVAAGEDRDTVVDGMLDRTPYRYAVRDDPESMSA